MIAAAQRLNGTESADELFDASKIDLLKRTLCKGVTEDELQIFLHACKRTRLDPFMRQIYPVKRWDKKAGREVMAIQTGIDGYRLIADRTGQYAGNDDPDFIWNNAGMPTQATVRVWKLVGGQRCSFTATARWTEYYPGDKQGYMWQKMPHVMLGKVAEALALRKAFPAELSGIYTDTEMDQAGEHADAVQAIDTPDLSKDDVFFREWDRGVSLVVNIGQREGRAYLGKIMAKYPSDNGKPQWRRELLERLHAGALNDWMRPKPSVAQPRETTKVDASTSQEPQVPTEPTESDFEDLDAFFADMSEVCRDWTFEQLKSAVAKRAESMRKTTETMNADSRRRIYLAAVDGRFTLDGRIVIPEEAPL